ncbi:MAG: hypothetical protein ACJ74Y_11645 [Bryobacteraceae bacterium]
MSNVGKRTACFVAAFVLAAGCAAPQAYTVSAKPGAVNYVEGAAYLNGTPVNEKDLKTTFLNANDILSTDLGKAEVLLAPGVFLRMGDNTKIRMVSPSLVATQVEVLNGEAMVESTGLVKGSSVQVISHGGSTSIEKNGLYRFLADDPPSVSVLDGKAAVTYSDRTVDVKKGRQVILAENLKPEKFDAKKDDELYAWSNVRSEFDAAASYRVARSAQMGLLGSAYAPGMGGVGNPGWFWDSAFSSWAWLPGAGAFYSPFGYGFYSPGLVGYAPVVAAPIYRGGRWTGGHWNGTRTPVNGWHGNPGIGSGGPHGGAMAAVPLSPNNPAAVGSVTASPWANHAARMQARQSFGASGLTTGSGMPARTFGGQGAGARPAGGSGWHGGSHPGGWSGGGAHPMGGAGGGGGHMSGGAGGHGGGGGGHR